MELGTVWYEKHTVDVVRRNGTYYETNCEKINPNDLIIAEIEKIKAEIINYIITPNTDEEEAIIEILDNHIAELKGE